MPLQYYLASYSEQWRLEDAHAGTDLGVHGTAWQRVWGTDDIYRFLLLDKVPCICLQDHYGYSKKCGP